MDYDAAALNFMIASEYLDAQAAWEVAVAADRPAESPSHVAPGTAYHYAERDENQNWIEEDL